MSAVRSKDSKIELAFRKVLWKAGYRYRKNANSYLGKPDVILKKHKTVVFIDSCFWHGCLYHCRLPHSNRAYWNAKIRRNKERDKEVTAYYKKTGWTVMRFWEHNIQNDIENCVKKIVRSIKNS